MREKLIELLNKVQDHGTKNFYEEHYIIVESKDNETIADFLIANGVTIPVRCKDCSKRYNPNECLMCHLVLGKRYESTTDDGYCYRGERRTEL